MATAPSDLTSQEVSPGLESTRRRSKRRRTSHLKNVPEIKSQRETVRAKCVEVASRLDKSRALSKDEMESVSRALLTEMGLDESYLGWTMVVLSGEFWRDQVAAIPPSRRLFLLPHCLKHAEGCPADYDQFGLDCRECGACSIADFRIKAEEMGYKVLVAEGSPLVLKIIVGGYVDAITGVACLNVLEKAIDKILLSGIPCMAVPLLSSDCRNTSVDEDWVHEMIEVQSAPPKVKTNSYLHLLRTASRMFEDEELNRLVPRVRGGKTLTESNGEGLAGLDPIAATEAIAYDFLSRGGKYSRPFITLAVHDALTGGKGVLPEGAKHLEELPDAVKRTAMAIETFHKASLVHDDIEDDDAYRYGKASIHKRYGVPTAINVGDYMIGLGYRLVARESVALGSNVAADILNNFSVAHMKLSEGQGAELLWRDSLQKSLQPLDALKIYALKTSPAFQAALYSGARLAGDVEQYEKPFAQFARHVGVAFQILNDLKDWAGDDDNKLKAGGDVFGGRPTVLWALALEALGPEQQKQLIALVENNKPTTHDLQQVRELYQAASVFEKAEQLVDKYRQKAEEVADEISPRPLRDLLRYLIDTVLDPAEVDIKPSGDSPQIVSIDIPKASSPTPPI